MAVALDSTQGLVATTIEIFFVDLLLSADNAVVIALACRSLPQDMVKRAMIFGTGAAIVLRILIAAVITVLLSISGLKLIGAIALALIAIKLMGSETAAEADGETDERALAAGRFRAMVNAILIVIAADFVMSLDNVIAIAALARGNVTVLIIGLAMSIPMLMFGSSIVHFLIERYPILITLGSAFLGYIAGGIAMDDPLVSGWADKQAPALSIVVPVLVALFVVGQAFIIRGEKAEAAAARGERLVSPSEKFATAAEIEATDSLVSVKE